MGRKSGKVFSRREGEDSEQKYNSSSCCLCIKNVCSTHSIPPHRLVLKASGGIHDTERLASFHQTALIIYAYDVCRYYDRKLLLVYLP